MDGRVLAEWFAVPLAQSTEAVQQTSGIESSEEQSGYTDEEAAQVAARLSALGYLE